MINLKALGGAGVGILAILLFGASSCTRVEPGHVGVKVNRYGTSAGVSETALGVGGYFTPPFSGIDIYEYPIYTNTYVWQRSKDEDGKYTPGEEISFQDKNGLVAASDITVAFRVDPVLAPKLFQTYRVGMDGIVASPLRNKVRSAIVAAASQMTVEEIYGPKKAVLIGAALQSVRRYFEPMGLHVDQLDWAGPVRIPPAILERINARAQNEQAAIAARAQVETVKAEAEASVAKAKGEADATTLKAKAEAEAIRIRADALANNPKIVAYEWVQRWDGKMPATVYCSASLPCVQGAAQ